jgi:hypothetical protein
MQKTADPWFATHIEKTVLDFVFGAFEGGHPVTYRRQFRLRLRNKRAEIETIALACPGDCPGGTGIAALGYTKAIAEFLQKRPELVQGTEESVRNLIKMEIEACPKSVGSPIAIIKLDAHGLTWLSDGVCNRKDPLPPAVPNQNLTCNESE